METDTPETDAKTSPHIGFYSCATVPTELARKLERERDEALEKIKQQKLEIVRLNGATNHAGGTPLKIALRERDEAREQLRKASVEANTLATSIQKAEYPDAKEFELLGSVAGVISQIDNMYAGVRQQRDEWRKKYKLSVDAVEIAARLARAESERDEAREDASHWKIEYEIVEARLCGGKHERDNGIVSEREIIPKLQRERDEAKSEWYSLQDAFEDLHDKVEKLELALSEILKVNEDTPVLIYQKMEKIANEALKEDTK